MNNNSISNGTVLPKELFNTKVSFPDGKSVDLTLNPIRYAIWTLAFLRELGDPDTEEKVKQKDELVQTILKYGRFEDVFALFMQDNKLAQQISTVILEKFFAGLDNTNWINRINSLVQFYIDANEGHPVPIINVNDAIDKIISMEDAFEKDEILLKLEKARKATDTLHRCSKILDYFYDKDKIDMVLEFFDEYDFDGDIETLVEEVITYGTANQIAKAVEYIDSPVDVSRLYEVFISKDDIGEACALPTMINNLKDKYDSYDADTFDARWYLYILLDLVLVIKITQNAELASQAILYYPKEYINKCELYKIVLKYGKYGDKKNASYRVSLIERILARLGFWKDKLLNK
jgi:hypothetical protein